METSRGYGPSMTNDGAHLADPEVARDDTRARIVTAAARLLAEGGRDAATTRAVAASAGVQAPTIYRLFGDMAGLLDAVAEYVLSAYVDEKAALEPHPDPVEELRRGWDFHMTFCLANPAVFLIMNGEPHAGPPSPAQEAGNAVLRRRLARIARAGRLRVSEPRALALLRATGTGTVLTLLEQPAHRRDLDLLRLAREAVIAAITIDAPPPIGSGPATAAIGLRAALPESEVLSAGEQRLLEEWLDRLAAADGPASS